MESEDRSNVVATFNCYWGDAGNQIYRKYFNSLRYDFDKEEYNIKESHIQHITIGNLHNDSRKQMVVCIKYYMIDDYLVGFWYPSSPFFDFDLCRSVLGKEHQNVIFTNDGNIHHILDVISRYRKNDEYKYKIVGFVDCGNEFVVNSTIEMLKGTYFNRIGKYSAHYYNRTIGYTCSFNKDNIQTTINIDPELLNGQKIVFWYIGSNTGSMKAAIDVVNRRYPDAKHYNIDQYEMFLEQSIK